MKSDQVQDKYSEAAFWDLVASQRVYAAFDKEEYEDVFDKTIGRQLNDQTIVDIGSASGVSAAILASWGARVYGIDISPELVEQSKKIWHEYEERIDFCVGDAEKLDFEDNSLGCCFFGGVLHHFPDCTQVYNEAYRVLSPGGKFVAIEPNRLDFLELIEWKVAGWRGKLSPNEYPLDPYQMKSAMEAMGFEDVRFWTMRHDIPVLAQLPGIKHWFNRKKGFAVKNRILDLINLFRPAAHCGTFFVSEGRKG